MKKGLLSTAIFVWTFSTVSWAGLGPEIHENETPGGLCLITLQSTGDMRTEICSGFLLDNQTVVTAGHCTEKMNSTTKVVCDGQSGQVESFITPESLDLDKIEFDVRLRSYDIAVVQLQTRLDLKLERREMATTVPELQKTLALSSKCGFFGFSRELGGSVSKSGLKVGAIELESQYLSFQDGYLQLDGTRGASALVQPGDSGGALACYNHGQWVLLGVTSGRDWDYQSFFAPLSSHDFLKGQSPPTLRESLMELEHISPATQLDISSGEEYFVRQYSKVIKTDATGFHDFDNVERLVQWEPVHSTLDHPVVRFRPEVRQGQHWLGTIEFSGNTMSYSCIYGFICGSGSMSKVLVHESDLQLTP